MYSTFYITCKKAKALCLDKKKKNKTNKNKLSPSPLLLNRPRLNAACVLDFCHLDQGSVTERSWAETDVYVSHWVVRTLTSQSSFAFSRHFLWKNTNSALDFSSGRCTVLTHSLWPEIGIDVVDFLKWFFYLLAEIRVIWKSSSKKKKYINIAVL